MKGSSRVSIKDAFLHLCKAFGLFRLSRVVTRHGLRILCYHGFASGDEVDFRPGLFVRPGTFERRLRTLREYGYPVVDLGTALEALDRGKLASGTTVITVDDVFYGFAAHAAPLLREFRFPVTAYVTTYYCVKGNPVFRLAVRYMFWKTTREAIELSDIDAALNGRLTLSDIQAKARAESLVIDFGEALGNEPSRVSLVERLGRLLGVDYEQLVRERPFSVVTPDEVRTLAQSGIDVQLHTHRHRLPDREEDVLREVADNRQVLEPLVGKPLRHLCYPSGIWSPVLWPWLESVGISSGTTCDPGLNYRGESRLGLKRILDAEDMSQICFEAELAGFKECLRYIRSRFRAAARPLSGRPQFK